MKKSLCVVFCTFLSCQAQSQDFLGGALKILNGALSNAQKIDQPTKQPVTPLQQSPQQNTESGQNQVPGQVNIFKTAPPINPIHRS